jgi:hypothetical protein
MTELKLLKRWTTKVHTYEAYTQVLGSFNIDVVQQRKGYWLAVEEGCKGKLIGVSFKDGLEAIMELIKIMEDSELKKQHDDRPSNKKEL